MNKPGLFLLIIIISVQLTSCDNQTVFEGKKDLKDGYWLYKEPIYFSFEIEDATRPYDLSFFVRNTVKYPYQNLYLQYYLEDSLGNVVNEKLYNILLFNQKTGKPTGSGNGDISTVEKEFLSDFFFPKNGLYRMRFDQFMRHDTLWNIQTVGLMVKKSEGKTE